VVYRKCLLAFVIGWMFNTVVNVQAVLDPVVSVVIRLSDLIRI